MEIVITGDIELAYFGNSSGTNNIKPANYCIKL